VFDAVQEDAMFPNQYFLRIERLTQNRFSGDEEIPVDPMAIDSTRNLHVYLQGLIADDRTVELRPKRRTLALNATVPTLSKQHAESDRTYKTSLPHYTLNSATSYLLRALDDPTDPWAMASCEIKTL
jgi:hypothetical protein